MKIGITSHERDTILAALRFWQREGLGSSGHEIMDIATNGGEHEPLPESAIDDLCERINSNATARRK